MKATWKGLLMIVVIVLLASCQPYPVDYADAYRIESETDQAALAAEQSRQQTQELHKNKMAREQYWLDIRSKVKNNVAKAANGIVWFVGWSLRLSLAATILGLGIGLTYAGVGTGKAWSIYVQERARVSAKLIPMDYKTRSYPALVDLGRNVIALTGTGMVRLMDKSQAAGLIEATYAGVTAHDGAVAYEARSAKQSTSEGVTALITPIIEFARQEEG